MVLTEERIRACQSDEELFQALSTELQRRLPARPGSNIDFLVDRLRSLPKGLRAMARSINSISAWRSTTLVGILPIGTIAPIATRRFMG
jgi:hypothetical protein